MQMMNGQLRWVALAALAMVASSGANATWTFTTGSGVVAADGTGISITGVTGAYAANGGMLTSTGSTIVTAGSAGCGTPQTGSNCTYGINGFSATSGTTWTAGNAASSLTLYGGGFGMSSDSNGTTAPNHALDNGPATDLLGTNFVTGLGNTEAILVNFSSSVILNSVTTGYVAGDSDFSLFRFSGGSAPSMSGVGTSLANMGTAGWSLVGNYNGGSNSAGSTTSVNSGNASSSWWLITAYNSAYGSGAGLDQGNDFFKLLALAGTKPTPPGGGGGGVPEPGSLALSAVALAGAFGIRRRRQQR